MTRRIVWLATFVAVLVLGFAMVAFAQSIAWVSVTSSGSGGVGPVAVSDDGRFVAFRSASATLVPGDSNGSDDVFVRDMQTGSVQRVSVSSSGVQGNGHSGVRTIDISNDGRYVLFDSAASNLVTSDSNGTGRDLYVRDRQTGTTTMIVRDNGQQGGVNDGGSISGNGRFVAFGGNFDDVTGVGVFVADLQTGNVERLVDTGGAFSTNTEATFGPRISDDGRYVAFVTRRFHNNDDIVLFDRNTDTYVIANPRIGGADPTDRISDGDMALSGNGRVVAFGNLATNLVPGDTPNTRDLFVFNANTNTLERIPIGQVSSTPIPALSFDGRYVAYIHGNVPGVGGLQLMVRDRSNGTDTRVTVEGATPGTVSFGSKSAISGNGRYVGFQSTSNFAGSTGGNQVFIWDRQGSPGGGTQCGSFTDVSSNNIFCSDIQWLAGEGITRGCNPPANTQFCPSAFVTRGQMAAFLVRALNLTETGPGFNDTVGHLFDADIRRLAAAGITRGCNPPANTNFCPNQNVTREQMAAFLRRALDN